MTSRKDVLSVRESFVPPGSRIHHNKGSRPRKVRKSEQTLFNVLCAWVVEHQVGLSINLISLLALVHLIFPRARRRTRPFIQLQYRDAATGQYSRGYADGYLVVFWVVAFTGLRAATMDYILKPLAQWAGVKSQKTRTRLAEQAWMLLYYVVFWTLGMYVMYQSEHWFDRKQLLSNFPTHKMDPLMKWYYLVQFAFWLQQIFVINIEARRKDHWQMFTHHIFTSLLMFSSYTYYHTKIGNAILCIMDLCDILLPFAKILKYLGCTTACDIAFGVFLVAWLITRHIFYNIVVWEIARQDSEIIPYACFDSVTGKRVSDDGLSAYFPNILQSFINPGGSVCWTPKISHSFVGLLLALQTLTIIWFGMIIRVAYGVLSGKAADDSRSDDEDDGEDEQEDIDLDWDEKAAIEAAVRPFVEPIEHEVGADEITGVFKNARAGSPANATKGSRKSTARTSAISIPGHSDRKELLGRIGCDKPS